MIGHFRLSGIKSRNKEKLHLLYSLKIKKQKQGCRKSIKYEHVNQNGAS